MVEREEISTFIVSEYRIHSHLIEAINIIFCSLLATNLFVIFIVAVEQKKICVFDYKMEVLTSQQTEITKKHWMMMHRKIMMNAPHWIQIVFILELIID